MAKDSSTPARHTPSAKPTKPAKTGAATKKRRSAAAQVVRPVAAGDTPPRLLNLKAQEWIELKMREISIGYRDQGLPKA